MMDEEDGRPGFVAEQFGHLDALTDVPTAFLCPACSNPFIFRIARLRGSSAALSHPSRKNNGAARAGYPFFPGGVSFSRTSSQPDKRQEGKVNKSTFVSFDLCCFPTLPQSARKDGAPSFIRYEPAKTVDD